MLDNVAIIFRDRENMMIKLKKKTYEPRMKEFREKHGHYFDEMLAFVGAAEDKEAAAKEVATVFCAAVAEEFSKKGKIKMRIQADLNLFMIYYVFPAILLSENEDATVLCDTIRDVWGESFKESKIGYTDYQTMYDGFQEKIFGIF